MERREFLELAGMLTAGAVLAPQVAFGSQNEISDITTVLNDENYDKEVYKHKGKAIVLFYGMWDESSHTIFPLFKELVRDYKNKVKFCSYELDESYKNWETNENAMEKWQKLKTKYDVDVIPRINMYVSGVKNDGVKGGPGKKVTESMIKDYIINWINKNN